MMLYKEKKPHLFSARFFPGEEYYPGFYKGEGNNRCMQCGNLVKDHLVSNDSRALVCPGTYIMYEGSQVINLMSRENFESIYEPLYVEEIL